MNPITAVVSGYSRVSFFFFQAEDGIRDHCVTGVQTCALPISRAYGRLLYLDFARTDRAVPMNILARPLGRSPTTWVHERALLVLEAMRRAWPEIGRASCRKECRSRWSPYH